MNIISVEGFTLSTIKYRENSKIINVLTKDKGIIGIIVKGALSPKSKLRVVSENFTYGIFHIVYKEGKLSTLMEVDVIDYLLNIKSDIEKLGYLSYLSELTKDVYKDESDNSIYDIFISGVKKIEEGFNPKVITNIIELKYLDYLGIGLYLNGCVVCNKPSIVSLSHSKGGYVCSEHRTNEPLYDDKFLKLIKAYYYIDISKITKLDIKNDVIYEIDKFITDYLKEYTGLYLKSKRFIDNLSINNY